MSASLTISEPPSGATIDAYPGDETDLLGKLLGYFESSEDASHGARAMAEKCADYYHGQQWSDEELAILRRRRQPPVVQNYVKRKVSLLLGLERKGRSDPKCFPRTPNEENLADVATQVLRYISDDVRYDVVRSSAYEDMLIYGVGGCEVIAEPEGDNDYRVNVNNIPWNRLFWDPHSAHPGFSDARFLGLVLWLDRDEALERYPGNGDILDATSSAERSQTYGDRPNCVWYDSKRQRVRVVQIWWRHRAEEWWTGTLTKGGFLDKPMKSPYIDRFGKATCPIIMRSIYTDRDLNRYGIVKDLLSPQDAVNKRESRLLHSLSVNQVILESGAVDDVDKLRNEAAKPDGVIEKNRGFELEIHKDTAEIQGQFQLLQHAIEQMNANGPNASMSGRDPRDLSGRAIIAQQSGGMAEAEPLSDALRQFSHKVYESCWMRAKQFWGPNKTIRVTDEQQDVKFVSLNRPLTVQDELTQMPPDKAQQIAAQMQLRPGDPRLQQVVRIEHDLNDMDVDITVEEGPDVPTLAAEQFQTLMMLPKEILMQFPPSVILKASSLRNKDELLKELEDHQQAQAANQQGAQAMQAAQIAKVQADAKDKNASALERMHSVASDHAVMPHQNALMAAQAAGAQANTLNTMHGIAMDHAAAAQPAPAEQPMAPTGPDPMALQAAAHGQEMDRAKLALAAEQQEHDQEMDLAAHGLAVKQANQPAPTAR